MNKIPFTIFKEDCCGCYSCEVACKFDDNRDTAAKCDLCLDRIQEGKAPSCSLICPTGCIVWGDKTG